MATLTWERRRLERMLRVVLNRLAKVGKGLSEIGEEGVRASLLQAIQATDLAAEELHIRAESQRSPRGPRKREPPTLEAAP